MNRRTANDRWTRFLEALLYIAQKAAGHERLGRTKLHKILCAADFAAFRELGETITGQDYTRQKHGPCANGMLPALEQLRASGRLVESRVDARGVDEIRPSVVGKIDLAVFSKAEIAILDRAVAAFHSKNATRASRESHRLIAWKAVRPGEQIDVRDAFLVRLKPSADEVRLAREVAKLGWRQA